MPHFPAHKAAHWAKGAQQHHCTCEHPLLQMAFHWYPDCFLYQNAFLAALLSPSPFTTHSHWRGLSRLLLGCFPQRTRQCARFQPLGLLMTKWEIVGNHKGYSHIKMSFTIWSGLFLGKKLITAMFTYIWFLNEAVIHHFCLVVLDLPREELLENPPTARQKWGERKLRVLLFSLLIHPKL